MLREGNRAILPADLKDQIPFEKLDGIVVLGLSKVGQENILMMSTLTLDELASLSKQLDSHITYLMGPMKEL